MEMGIHTEKPFAGAGNYVRRKRAWPAASWSAKNFK
jgi:hypothetical protein